MCNKRGNAFKRLAVPNMLQISFGLIQSISGDNLTMSDCYQIHAPPAE
jgi:hypothetical protein